MTPLIRPLVASDYEQWLPHYVKYLEFYETTPNEQSVALVWGRITVSTPTIQGLGAFVDGSIVGITHFHFQVSTWADTSHCYLEDLFVAPNFRGQGIAGALIAEVRKIAIEQGSSELYWITRATNETAQKLYDKVATKTNFLRYEIKLEDK